MISAYRIILLLILSVSILIYSACTGRQLKEKAPDIMEPDTAVKGYASYYAHKFHGRKTANGETYDMYGLSAAHKTLPFNTVLEVVNLNNNKSVVVRINDRGPFIKGRDIDLSLGAARKLDMIVDGVVPVKMIFVTGESPPPLSGDYSIQIGSFKDRDNAENLLKRMKSAGYDGYIEIYGDFSRVRIGPFSGIDSAEIAEQELIREGFDTFVVLYDRP